MTVLKSVGRVCRKGSVEGCVGRAVLKNAGRVCRTSGKVVLKCVGRATLKGVGREGQC